MQGRCVVSAEGTQSTALETAGYLERLENGARWESRYTEKGV